MPRAGLTPERIISEAAAVADEVGLDRLTLAAVAQRCGVSLPGLYKHVRGLDEVRRGIALLAVRELAAAITCSGLVYLLLIAPLAAAAGPALVLLLAFITGCGIVTGMTAGRRDHGTREH